MRFVFQVTLGCWGLLLLGAGFVGPCGAAESAGPRVLLLSSYHSGHYWQQVEIDGALSVLKRERPDVQADVEYLDLVRFPTQAQKARIVPALLDKYGTNTWKVVLLFDQSGMEFGLQHRDRLFPNTPTVFCGVEDFPEERARTMPDVTGVIERMDPAANARFALTLQPEIKRIVIIRGDPNSEGEAEAVRAALPFNGASPQVELFSEFNAQELFTRLERMPEDSAILFSGFARAQDYITEIQRRARVPIYPMQWPTYRGLGMGGVMVDAAYQGEDAGAMAVRILNGEEVRSIPIQRKSRYRSVVDVQTLRRFGISESRVPAGCEFVNYPPTLWSEHRRAVLVTGGVLGALTALVCGLLVAFRQKHRAERALFRSEGRFRRLVEGSEDLVLELDEAGAVTYASPNTRVWLGVAPDSVVGRRLEELTLKEGPGEAPTTNGHKGRQLHRFRHADATTRYMESSGRLETNAGVMVLRDVTERVESEARRMQVEQRQRQAEKMQALGTLAGGVAHELNNLLTPILGQAQLLETLNPDDDTAESAREIKQAASRAAEVVKGILTFARAGSNELKPVGLGEVVEEARKLLRASIPPDVVIEAGGDSTRSPVLADRTRLGQVLLNLGLNASHAMPRGGTLSMTVGSQVADEEFARKHSPLKPGPKIVLTVRDTGAGMTRATLARVFEPFFTTKPPGQGTGLGLSVVLGIVQDHGAAIEVDSVEGVGTTIRIYFEPAGGIAAARPAGVNQLPRGKGQHVLMVDDEPAVGRVGIAMLKRLGYEAELVTEPETALPRIEDPGRPEIQLVISDLNMPGINGRTLLRSILKAKPGIKVVLASGQAPDAEAGQPAAPFLPKPYTLQSLASVVAGSLEQTRS